MSENKNILLSISILVSRKKDTLIKCLESIKTLRNSISSELIIVDTGCNSESREIIEKYADQIVDFVWCDDFSKARNAGLEKASGKWFLYLDDDEWFEDTTEIINFFQTGEYKKYQYAMYIQRNYRNFEGTSYDEAPVGRMIQLDAGVHFIYSIHECFNEVGNDVKFFKAYVHHYGYVYATREEELEHAKRNIVPLLREHEKEPENLKHVLQLAQEYGSIGEYEKSVKITEDAIENFASEDWLQMYYYNSLVILDLKGLMLLHQYEKFLENAKKYLDCSQTNILTRAYVYGLMNYVYLKEKKEKESFYYTEKYFRIYQDYVKNSERYAPLESSITKLCFAKRTLIMTLGNGIAAAIAIKKIKQAEQWNNFVNWDEDIVYIEEELIFIILDGLADTEEQWVGSFLNMCNKMLCQKQFIDMAINRIIRRLNKAQGEEWKKIIHRFSLLDIKDEFWDMLRVLDGHIEIPVYLWEKVVKLLLSNRSSKEMEHWDRQVQSVFKEKIAIDSVAGYRKNSSVCVTDSPQNCISIRDYYKFIWDINVLYQKIKTIEKSSFDEVKRLLLQYAQLQLKWSRQIYQSELIENGSFLLPRECQAAIYIENFQKQTDTEQYNEAIESLKNILKLYSEWAEVVRICSDKVKELLQQKEEQQKQEKAEFALLAQKIKQQVKVLLRFDRKEEAKQILLQLQVMVPRDREVQELLKKLEK